ncbi:DUF2306 domain-containing protein [Planctopirus ephydatiae]|nr:DUF2306 domain-containing protein [Planctopirus ephydatiae]
MPVMSAPRLNILLLLLRATIVLLILRVTIGIVSNYPDYLPPDFDAEFLRNREGYFFGVYAWAFYAHIVSGPLAIVFGLVLLSGKMRSRWPVFHRWLGRVQVLLVVGVLAPSGLVMSYWAASGPIGGISLATLSILTTLCMLLGWRAAVRRQYARHRRWMERTMILLCSAITLRVIVGTALVTHAQISWIDPEMFDPVANWLSWVVPLLIYESWSRYWRQKWGFPPQ